MRKSSRLGLAAAIGLALVSGASRARALGPEADPLPWWAGDLAVSTGFDFSHGDYDEPVDTDLLYVPVTASYLFDHVPWWPERWDQIEISLTVPYLRIDGPGTFFIDERGFDQAERTVEEGLGDLLLSGTYIWFPRADTPWPIVEFGVQWKIPTGDVDRGLGTGKSDVALELDLARSWGRFTTFLTVGYRFIGDPDEGQLDDAWFASAGLATRIAPRLDAGISWTWLEATSPSRSDSHELLAFASIRLRDRLTLSPYAVAGLAGYAPDWGVGLTLRYELPIRGRR
ncbi:MAG: transporter [Myxococcales bacterium]|nr:transporter [Myxococcales bacterium]